MSQSWIEITLEVDKAEAEDWVDALLEAYSDRKSVV